tara:strand:+ start:1282 stop:1692 length:411 start_codon:yes stop_codon:yes gene_type:complete
MTQTKAEMSVEIEALRKERAAMKDELAESQARAEAAEEAATGAGREARGLYAITVFTSLSRASGAPTIQIPRSYFTRTRDGIWRYKAHNSENWYDVTPACQTEFERIWQDSPPTEHEDGEVSDGIDNVFRVPRQQG